MLSLHTPHLGTFTADDKDETNISSVIKILESSGETSNLMAITAKAIATLVYFIVWSEQRQYGRNIRVHEQHLDDAVNALEADLKRFKRKTT